MTHERELDDRQVAVRHAAASVLMLAVAAGWLVSAPFEHLLGSRLADWLVAGMMGLATVAMWLLALSHGRRARSEAARTGMLPPIALSTQLSVASIPFLLVGFSFVTRMPHGHAFEWFGPFMLGLGLLVLGASVWLDRR